MLVTMRATTFIALLVLALGGCGDEDGPAGADGPRSAEPPAVALGCDDHVEPPRPAGVAYRGVTMRWGDAATLNVEPAGPPSKVVVGERAYWLWKAPIGLSANTRVELSFGGEGRGQFFRSNHPASEADLRGRAVITSCAPDTPLFSGPGVVGKMTGFAFGFLTDSPTCTGLELRARVDGELRTSPLGNGRRCSAPQKG